MSIKKRIQSFKYALEGLEVLFRTEVNARIHLVIAILVVGMGFYFHLATWEWLIIILTIGFVIVAEVFNTAIEKLTDLASPDIHPLAKKVKDMAAGAVLLSTVVAMILGVIIFWKHVF